MTNETVSHEDLGGARVHNAVSGVAHQSFENDLDALQGVRKLLGYLPQCSPAFAASRPGLAGNPPRLACTDPANRDAPTLDTIVPLDSKLAYDMNEVIKGVRSRSLQSIIQILYCRIIQTYYSIHLLII